MHLTGNIRQKITEPVHRAANIAILALIMAAVALIVAVSHAR